MEIILHISKQSPDLLYHKFHNHRDIHASAQLLPCDHIKMLPDSKHIKYRLLAGMVNASLTVTNAITHALAHPDSPSTKKVDEVKRLFSIYSGEEEVIIRGVSYGLLVTDEELQTKTFNFEKVSVSVTQSGAAVDLPLPPVVGIASVTDAATTSDSPLISTGETILHRWSRVSVIDLNNTALHKENLLTFKLVMAVLRSRIAQGTMTAEVAEGLVGEVETGGVDMNTNEVDVSVLRSASHDGGEIQAAEEMMRDLHESIHHGK